MLRFSLPHPNIAKRVLLKRVLLFALLAFGAVSLGSSTVVPISVEAVQCLPGQETCAVPGGVVCEGQCYQGKRCTRNDLVPDPTCTQTTLTITNVSHGTPLTDQATITWATNLAATHVVKYGLSATALTSQQVNTLPMSTSHSVRIMGLQPSTTYYYQAFSETAALPDEPGYQKASSSTRSFTTAAGTPSGSGPSITFGPRADATDTYADITFRTDVPTAALVEYDRQNNTNVDPTSPTYAQACSPAASACPPPAVPPAGTTTTDHTVRVTNFVQPSQSQKFYYRVTVTDSNGNALATAEFFFNTSANSTDHVFTTGGCSDGVNQIPIGQCAADGRYCRTGGQLTYDCRPGLACTTACPTGSTCLANGDCSADPALTGSPTECNSKFCYQKCDGNSGAKSGLPCTADSDCEIGLSRGSCVVGSFNNPAVPGCRASWPGCDANIILKVRPDRVCDKWLYCNTSVETTNAFGKKENQCFDLAICDSLSPSGNCNDKLEGGQCENDPLRFCYSDADCQGLGECRLQSSANNIPLTYRTPQNVDKIKNLSGYAYAGLEWWEQPGSPPPVEGYYPLSFAKQVGQKLEVQNGDFEDTVIQGTCAKTPIQDCSNDETCSNIIDGDRCELKVVRDPLVASLWEPISPTGSTNPSTASRVIKDEGGVNNRNYFLRVVPTDKAGSGAWTSRAMNLRPTGGAQYLVTLRMRSEQDEQPYQVSLVNEAGQETVLDESPGDNVGSPVELTSEWKSYRLGPETVGGGLSRLAFKTTVSGTSVSFDVDDIAFFPALQVNDTTRLPQDCRLYPNENAAKCEYLDQNGVLYQGLKGYCLERDPQNSAVCLSWWPVDIISGSNIFEQEANVGYSDRRPLYACAETEGKEDEIIDYERGFENVYYYSAPGRILHFQIPKPAIFDAIPISDIAYFNVNLTWASSHSPPTKSGTFPAANCSDKIPDFTIGTHTSGDPNFTFRVYPNVRYEENTNESIIARIRFVDQDKKRPNPSGYCSSGFDYETWNVGWSKWKANDGDDFEGGNDMMGFGMRIQTDGVGPNNHMSVIELKGIDDEDGSASHRVRVTVVRKSTCTKLVQVATADDDSAWADRTAQGSTYFVPDLNFRQVSDLAPFAAAVNQNNNLPSLWNYLPLEAPFKQLPGPQYQPRSGGPFACVGDKCTGRYCDGYSGRKYGDKCLDSTDCIDGTYAGSCIGGGICLEYDTGSKTYKSTSSKQACTGGTAFCPPGLVCCTNPNEECVGGASVNRGTQILDNTAVSNNPRFAQYRIQRLFAEAFSIWEWDEAQRKYVDSTNQAGLFLWTPPETLCRRCQGGPSDGKACTANASCGTGTCVDADIHPKQNADPINDSAADYCSIKPKITRVFDAEQQLVTIDEGNPYSLRFNSKVDPEQLPLTKVMIDWGDGSTLPPDPIRINDRQSESKPHVYAHPYDCQSDPNALNAGDCKKYEIRLQIQDNWGWCDNGANQSICPPQTDAARPWTKGPTIQVKRN